MQCKSSFGIKRYDLRVENSKVELLNENVCVEILENCVKETIAFDSTN